MCLLSYTIMEENRYIMERINLNLFMSNVPNVLKLARMVPLCKLNNKTDVAKYRLLSVLQVDKLVSCEKQMFV